MCTAIVSRKNVSGKLPTVAEKRVRMETLRHITPDELNHCRKVVYKAVPSSLGDPEEALSEALEIALKKYEGWGKLSTFVGACARNSALHYYSRRTKRLVSFEEIINEARDKVNENWDSCVDRFGEDAPEFVEPIDPQLVDRIRKVLVRTINYKQRSLRPTVIAAAQKILSELCESSNKGAGIGVTEYDEAPLKALDYKGQVHFDRNTKVARQEMYRHLAERCGTDEYTVTYAMTALRKSTQIALSEHQSIA